MKLISSSRFSRKHLVAACQVRKTPGRVGGIISKLVGLPEGKWINHVADAKQPELTIKHDALLWPIYEYRDGELIRTGTRAFEFDDLPLEIVIAFALVERLERLGQDSVIPALFRTIVMDVSAWEAFPDGSNVSAAENTESVFGFVAHIHRLFTSGVESRFVYDLLDFDGLSGAQDVGCFLPQGQFSDDISDMVPMISIPMRSFIGETLYGLNHVFHTENLPQLPAAREYQPQSGFMMVSDAERQTLEHVRSVKNLLDGTVNLRVSTGRISSLSYSQRYGKVAKISELAKEEGTQEITTSIEAGATRAITVKRCFNF